ncbi:hypothetical protein FOZ60_012348 [Perkinsus olseni]|uniref:Reverse transcriptase domain-containing protein n=1 Tax=Perkinsus olseni TaxID=32597 RepID=A0A7J6NCS6_PEROL|nr:hypothetical protein FOZ60_012348 [Perkinsus olseni]
MPAVQDIIQLTIQGQQGADVWGPKIVTSLEAYGIVSALLLSSISEDTIAAVTSNACEGTAANEIDQKKHNVKTVIKGAATEAANQLRLLHERSLTEERGRAKKLAVDLPALCRTAHEAGTKISFLPNMLPPLPAMKKVHDNPLLYVDLSDFRFPKHVYDNEVETVTTITGEVVQHRRSDSKNSNIVSIGQWNECFFRYATALQLFIDAEASYRKSGALTVASGAISMKDMFGDEAYIRPKLDMEESYGKGKGFKGKGSKGKGGEGKAKGSQRSAPYSSPAEPAPTPQSIQCLRERVLLKPRQEEINVDGSGASRRWIIVIERRLLFDVGDKVGEQQAHLQFYNTTAYNSKGNWKDEVLETLGPEYCTWFKNRSADTPGVLQQLQAALEDAVTRALTPPVSEQLSAWKTNFIGLDKSAEGLAVSFTSVLGSSTARSPQCNIRAQLTRDLLVAISQPGVPEDFDICNEVQCGCHVGYGRPVRATGLWPKDRGPKHCGFGLSYEDGQVWKNYRSADDVADLVQATLDDEVAKGHMAKLPAAPEGAVITKLACVSKPNGKVRLIDDLRRSGVNEKIHCEETICLPGLASAAFLVQQQKKRSPEEELVWIEADIASAFRHIPVHVEDQKLLLNHVEESSAVVPILCMRTPHIEKVGPVRHRYWFGYDLR